MKLPSSIPASLLAFAAALTSPVWAGGPFEVDYPNLVKPSAQFGTYGNASGEFNEPSGLYVSNSLEIFVSDCYNKRVQVFDRAGLFQRALVIPDAMCPQGLVLGENGELYVADLSDRVLVLDSKTGELVRSFGTRGSGPGQLIRPTNLALHGDRVYVVDEGNNRIAVFTLNGKYLKAIGRFGRGHGAFTVPRSVILDDSGNIYVSDIHHRIQKFSGDGKFLMQWGRYGGLPGDFAEPADISYAMNTIYVADLVNHRIQAFDTNGKFKLTWGRHPEAAHEGQGMTHYPAFAKVSPKGDLVAMCEPFEYRCQVFDGQSIANMPRSNALAWWQKYPKFHYGSGKAIERVKDLERLFAERGLGKPQGDIGFLTEPDIHRVIAFDIDTVNNKLTVRWAAGSYGSGPLKWAMLSARSPVISRGSLFVGDYGNNVFQELDLLTGKYKATHFKPGTGHGEFNGPTDIAEAANGDLYIGDYNNARIQVFDKDLKYKFEFGGLGDGPGKLFNPMGPAFSPSGDRLYVPDTGNRRISVFDPQGKYLFSFGRTSKPGEYGNGTFQHLFNIAVAPSGDVYATDSAQQLVQKFDPDGKFLLQWGGWGTNPGQFYKPKGISVGSDGKVFVVDFGNHRGQIFDGRGSFLAIFGEGILFPKEALDEHGKPKAVDQHVSAK